MSGAAVLAQGDKSELVAALCVALESKPALAFRH